MVTPGEGMTLYLHRTKTEHDGLGAEFKAPALSRLCPVSAYRDWIDLATLTAGPVFRRIGAKGHLGTAALHPNSLVPLLRRRILAAGIAMPDRYTGHSRRRGFATWANGHDWDVKDLMEYVGWKDAGAAMRYIERADGRYRIEQALAQEASGAAARGTSDN